jgi:hypothetical protein
MNVIMLSANMLSVVEPAIDLLFQKMAWGYWSSWGGGGGTTEEGENVKSFPMERKTSAVNKIKLSG